VVGLELEEQVEPEQSAPPEPAAQPPQTAPTPQSPSAPAEQQPTISAAAVAFGASAAAMAAAASVGALVLARGRRTRHELLELPLNGDPQSDTPVRGGFAEVDPSRELAQDLPQPGALTLVGHVQRMLDQSDSASSARIVLQSYGRSRSSVVVQAPDQARAALRGLAPVLASRLGMPVEVRTSRDGDVVFEIGMRGQLPSAEAVGPRLLPMCLLIDRREVWLDPELAGHVLVASLPGGGAEQVTTALLASLAGRAAPGEVKLWTIATAEELPALLDGLPQQVKPRASSRNALELEAALRDVRAELIHRMQRPESAEVAPDEPDIVLVIGELACLDYATHRTTLDMLGAYGPSHGVRLIAATRDSSRVADELIALFKTRLVLRAGSAEDSQRLLGQGDAADLLGGGQLWARLAGRAAQEGYGMRIRPDLLERFVRLLRSRHGLPPFTAPRTPAGDATPAAPRLMQLADVDTEPADNANVIHVRCFGGFDVCGPGGELVPSVDELTGDAAWDVLAVLAASPEGAVDTAELLDDVWPAMPRADAEDRLRTALRSLHVLLARATPAPTPDVVRFAADNTCHLDTRLVISDVHRFLRLCRAAPQMPPDQARMAWQRARGLYRGQLLDGPGARAWPWASRSDVLSLRERYREHAYKATVGMARLASSERRLGDAVMLYSELLSVEPTLEDVIREVCECYLQMGDYAAVRAEETRLNNALHAAYLEAGPDDSPLAYEPEPATLALFERAHAEAPAAAVAD
jgi:DNA-binding SARP family transcriptional activator